MENFTLFNPTKVFFGQNVVDKLAEQIVSLDRNVLLVYGKGSVKKYGYYDKVKNQLTKAGCTIHEYSGIKPNPVVDDVEKAVAMAREKNVGLIVALGGGSVIDSAKIMSLCIPANLPAWDVMTWKKKPVKAVPLITILTLAATGTEMNDAAVLQNHHTGQKTGFVSPLMYPLQSYLDPAFTITVPANYTAYGIADLMAHALEAYFGEGDSALADEFVYAILRDAIKNGPELLKNLESYELRAKIMLDAMAALNGITTYGKKVGDWGVHDIGHSLSLLYDLPHGATLSIAYPAWLKQMSNSIPEKIIQLGHHVFGSNSVTDTIVRLENFFRLIQCPVRLQDMGLPKDNKTEIVSLMIKNNVTGIKYKLLPEQLEKITGLMFD